MCSCRSSTKPGGAAEKEADKGSRTSIQATHDAWQRQEGDEHRSEPFQTEP